MTPQNRALRRYQGAMNKALGAAFEKLISAGCDYYRAKGIADIEKTPEPMAPVRDLGGGRFIAHYTAKSQTDFKGFMRGGRAVCIEAKHTTTGRIEQDRVTDRQAACLSRAEKYGAWAFVLVSFSMTEIFRVPWSVWSNMRERFDHKYITPKDAAPYKVRVSPHGALLFLEGIGELYT